MLRWDARKEDKGKHGKFDFLWFGPFKISQVFDNNTFILQNIEDQELIKSPINEHFIIKSLLDYILHICFNIL